MKKTNAQIGSVTRNTGLDALETHVTGKLQEDPRRDNYPLRLQSLYFPQFHRKENK